jgi:transcriptional regulator of acetoin/glycerol metabolism
MGAQIRRAWERFVSGGARADAAVRDVVTRSWGRSADFHVGFDRRRAPKVEDGELHRKRVESATIISAAATALERSRNFLTDAGSMMILIDADGLIVATEGDPRVIDKGRENHLELGGLWHERQIGTNAIGTALAERAAVQIHGSEHYCEDVQSWTCAAAPVTNPANRQIVGIVDISGRVVWPRRDCRFSSTGRPGLARSCSRAPSTCKAAGRTRPSFQSTGEESRAI